MTTTIRYICAIKVYIYNDGYADNGYRTVRHECRDAAACLQLAETIRSIIAGTYEPVVPEGDDISQTAERLFSDLTGRSGIFQSVETFKETVLQEPL